MITSRFYSSQHDPEANEIVGRFVRHVIWGGSDREFSRFCSMGVWDGPDLIAGVVYHNVDPEAGVIEMSAGSVSKRWLQSRVIRMMIGIPFDVLGCQTAILRVKGSNVGMIAIARRFGFSEHIIPRLAGRDEVMHIFLMTEECWRAHRLYITPN